MEWYHVCWPRLTAKRVDPVVSISWASCLVKFMTWAGKVQMLGGRKFDSASRNNYKHRQRESQKWTRCFAIYFGFFSWTVAPRQNKTLRLYWVGPVFFFNRNLYTLVQFILLMGAVPCDPDDHQGSASGPADSIAVALPPDHLVHCVFVMLCGHRLRWVHRFSEGSGWIYNSCREKRDVNSHSWNCTFLVCSYNPRQKNL